MLGRYKAQGTKVAVFYLAFAVTVEWPLNMSTPKSHFEGLRWGLLGNGLSICSWVSASRLRFRDMYRHQAGPTSNYVTGPAILVIC
jgi:hypothetical protein